jgi:hypothetical protein
VTLFHRLGVYLGVSDESDEDCLYREEADARSAGYPVWRIALNAVLTFALGTWWRGCSSALCSTPSR